MEENKKVLSNNIKECIVKAIKKYKEDNEAVDAEVVLHVDSSNNTRTDYLLGHIIVDRLYDENNEPDLKLYYVFPDNSDMSLNIDWEKVYEVNPNFNYDDDFIDYISETLTIEVIKDVVDKYVILKE